MSEKRFRYDSSLEKVYDDNTYNGETTESYGVFECYEIMNEQQEKITELKIELTDCKNRKEQCNYKKAILDFLKFMNMNSPLTEIMVDEFLEEVYDGESYERETI